jgi:hypothetical protein
MLKDKIKRKKPIKKIKNLESIGITHQTSNLYHDTMITT